jgi:hypothetical protein
VSDKFETFAEFFKAVRDASESPVVDSRLRISEDLIRLILTWIAMYHPEKLDQAIKIVWHTDEGVNK